MKLTFVVACCAGSCLGCAHVKVTSPEISFTVQHRVLWQFDKSVFKIKHASACMGGRNIAIVLDVNNKLVVYSDGRRVGEFDEIGWMRRIGKNRERLVFCASQGGQWYVVDEQRKFGPYSYVLRDPWVPWPLESHLGLKCDALGKRIVYQARSREGWSVYLDGRKQATDSERWLEFDQYEISPDGKSFAIAIKENNNKNFLVRVNGREQGKTYDEVQNLKFSSNNRLSFIGVRESKAFVVVDGAESDPLDGIHPLTSPIFSADGTRFAYVAQQGGSLTLPQRSGGFLMDYGASREQRGVHYFAVIDGVKGKLYDWIGTWDVLTFSPDGLKVAYRARLNGNWYMIVNDEEFGPYSEIQDPIFSPDGSQLIFAARKDDGWFVVVNGKEWGPYYSVHDVCFSPNGKRIAFIATRRFEGDNIESILVVDAKEVIVEKRRLSGIIFSRDESRVACLVSDAPGLIAITPTSKFSGDGFFAFSPCSKYLISLKRKKTLGSLTASSQLSGDSETTALTINGIATPFFDDIFYSGMRYYQPKTLQFLARCDNKILRVTVKISSQSPEVNNGRRAKPAAHTK